MREKLIKFVIYYLNVTVTAVEINYDKEIFATFKVPLDQKGHSLFSG